MCPACGWTSRDPSDVRLHLMSDCPTAAAQEWSVDQRHEVKIELLTQREVAVFLAAQAQRRQG